MQALKLVTAQTSSWVPKRPKPQIKHLKVMDQVNFKFANNFDRTSCWFRILQTAQCVILSNTITNFNIIKRN